MLRNRTYIYTQFDAKNAGNSISELLDFKIFWGACPQTPLAKGALRPLVNTVAYYSQTGCLLQTLLKPLHWMDRSERNSYQVFTKGISIARRVLADLKQNGLGAHSKEIPTYTR